jgi:hypothetical protein
MGIIEKAFAAFDTGLSVSNSSLDINQMVTKIATWVGIIAGALAFIYLLYSGILYITANGNPDQAKKAQTGILNAIIGIIIIVLAYGIFTAIRSVIS